MLQRYLIRPIGLGAKSFRLHKLRSLLTVLGVVFGVASVIVMLAVGEGARTEAVRAIEELGANNIIVRSVKPARLSANREALGAIRYGLTFSDLKRIQATLPGLPVFAPTRDHQRDVWCHERRLSGRVVGLTPEYRSVHDIQLTSGRFINSFDVQDASTVAVLGDQAAKRLFPLSDPLGKFVRIGEDQYFRVIGVLKPRATSPGLGSSLPAQDFGRDIYIPLTTDRQRFGENVTFDRSEGSVPEKLEISQLVVSLPGPEHVPAVGRLLESSLALAKKDEETVLTIPLDLLFQAEQAQQVFTWVLAAIASISLLVGGIGIMNIMLATVTERTREIGIRRALGAFQRDIVMQFLIETAILSACGGFLGIALGVACASLASEVIGIRATVSGWGPCLAFGISLLVGLVFGIYPAYRAARMSPVEALRNE